MPVLRLLPVFAGRHARRLLKEPVKRNDVCKADSLRNGVDLHAGIRQQVPCFVYLNPKSL